MNLIYNSVIYLYLIAIKLASPFNKKARLWAMGRRNIFKTLKEKFDPHHKTAWFHCASLGEFEQARQLIETFKEWFPDHKILLTFFSPSGFETRKNYDKADYIFYLPIDTSRNAKKFIDIVNPGMAFFIKYEYWFNYLSILKSRDIPVYIVSAIFRTDQHFFKAYGSWFRKQLKNISHFFVQNTASLELLKSIGIENAKITGDTRFDRVYKILKEDNNFPLVDSFKQNSILIIAGSTWEEDEDILLIFKNKFPQHKLIIAPHEIHESRIHKLKMRFGKDALLFSEANNKNISSHSVLIIDSIGKLSYLYKYSDIAFIGGGFGAGIHNILEAATFGNPILFGPKYHKFQEAKDLVNNGGAFPINDSSGFIQIVESLVENKDKLNRASEISKTYVEVNKGASEKILKHIKHQVFSEKSQVK